MTNGKRRAGLLILLFILILSLALPAMAAGYSKVYGQTKDKMRVRESASGSARIIDQIKKNAAVWIVNSKTSGDSTFVQVRYRGYEGTILTGWLCQTDGDNTYVKIMSATQAEKTFKVKDGDLPSTRVGILTKKQREEAKAGSSSSSSSSAQDSGSATMSASTVKDVQTKLKALGIYSGEVTGHAGDKTVAAIKAFQKKYGLTADGVAGGKTMEKLNEVYKSKGGTASNGSSSSSSSTSSSTISAVQTKLKALGFYWGEITGNAGEKTVTAIKSFQKKYGLTADGVAGAKTVAKIDEVYKSKGSPSSSTSSSTSTSSSSKTLKRDSTGSAVRVLQENLTSLGYYNGDITGHFGTMTEEAVKKFQKAKGLEQTGIVTSGTQKAIASAMNGSASGQSSVALYGRTKTSGVYLRSGHSTSASSKMSLPSGAPMKITKKYTSGGSTWYYASRVWRNGEAYSGWVNGAYVTLTSYSDYHSSVGSSSNVEIAGLIRVTHDGVMIREGPGTSYGKAGVANKNDTFYYVSHSDGWYKLKSGYYIMDSYATRVSDSEASSYSSSGSSSSSGTTYRNGDSGATVSWIQQTLKDLGMYAGSVTGHFGNKTEAAVKAFQNKHGLTADGVVGGKTMAALRNAASGGSTSSSEVAPVNVGAKIYNLNWFQAKANGVLSKLGLMPKHHARLTDLRTGKSFNIYIQSVGNHLDVEPLAASDTSILCSIYNVSSASYINYVRRPMLITTDTDDQIVCSIYGTPHGQQNITNNNFPGQFCLHFYNSKTHNSDKVDSDHMAAISEAISIVGSSKVTTISSL